MVERSSKDNEQVFDGAKPNTRKKKKRFGFETNKTLRRVGQQAASEKDMYRYYGGNNCLDEVRTAITDRHHA